MERMTIEIKKCANETVFELAGRLDTITAPALEDTIGENLSTVQALVLDMKEIEYVSSAGLRVLLGTQKKLQSKGGSMKLTNVCEEVMEILEMTGFADILVISN